MREGRAQGGKAPGALLGQAAPGDLRGLEGLRRQAAKHPREVAVAVAVALQVQLHPAQCASVFFRETPAQNSDQALHGRIRPQVQHQLAANLQRVECMGCRRRSVGVGTGVP